MIYPDVNGKFKTKINALSSIAFSKISIVSKDMKEYTNPIRKG